MKRDSVPVQEIAQALSTVANSRCSCGGRPPDASDACEACLYYHAVMEMLGIADQWEVGIS